MPTTTAPAAPAIPALSTLRRMSILFCASLVIGPTTTGSNACTSPPRLCLRRRLPPPRIPEEIGADLHNLLTCVKNVWEKSD